MIGSNVSCSWPVDFGTLCFLGRLRGHESYITRQMLKRHQIEVYNSNRQESRVKDVSHVNSHHIHLVERF